MNAFTALHVFLYQLTGGKIGGRFRGAPVLLLTTTGRKSGKRRTTPLLYITDGGKYAVVASNGGKPRDPSWWNNLKKKNPRAEIQLRSSRKSMVARHCTQEEKAKYWPLLAEMYPAYNDYQEKTDREIPIVLLEPVPS